jgi:hypothetical protein
MGDRLNGSNLARGEAARAHGIEVCGHEHFGSGEKAASEERLEAIKDRVPSLGR